MRILTRYWLFILGGFVFALVLNSIWPLVLALGLLARQPDGIKFSTSVAFWAGISWDFFSSSPVGSGAFFLLAWALVWHILSIRFKLNGITLVLSVLFGGMIYPWFLRLVYVFG